MHIIEKEEDIRMLHYLGLKSNQIFSLYMFYGIFQGLLGGIIGLIFGLAILRTMAKISIISMKQRLAKRLQGYRSTYEV